MVDYDYYDIDENEGKIELFELNISNPVATLKISEVLDKAGYHRKEGL